MLHAVAQDKAPQRASESELKTEAFKELMSGHFEKTNELLNQAAQASRDPSVARMAIWSQKFEDQRLGFVAERHKQYEKAMANVELLVKNNKDGYALEAAADACSLCDDMEKKAFRQDDRIDDLIQRSVKLAADYEANEQWLKALLFYRDLASIESEKPLWKDKLKATTRRIRILSMYAPDALKKIQEAEYKDRDEVDALLHPDKKPATRPAEKEANESFKTDWHDTLKDVQLSMLSDALADARSNYYRDVFMRDMLLGGLNDLKTMATTKGIEGTFPKLADADKKQAFLARIDKEIDQVKDPVGGSDPTLMPHCLENIQAASDDTVSLPEEVLAFEFADGAFGELDLFTNMIWPSEYEEFLKATQGEFSGVGIQIQSDDDGNLRVITPLEDSPAYRQGIRAGDIITRINGKNAKGININQAVKTITGPSGTLVTLTIRRPATSGSKDDIVKDYTIKRQTIKVASIKGWSHKVGGGWDYMIDADQKIAYMRLTSFTHTTRDELDKAMDEFARENVRGIILDLRNNPGGLLQQAIEVCDKFLSEGTIVSTHAERPVGGNPPTIAKAKPDADDVTLPLVVLVNQYSASASEIVSGCLKDDKRALIVGERTFGKGSVQMLFPLVVGENKACLKLTTSHYYLPSGRCIHREENSTTWGVDPDVTIAMTPDQMRLAMNARQALDVLHGANDSAATAPEDEKPDPVLEKAKKDPLGCDAQLSGALFLLRLQLSGAQFVTP